MVSILEVYKLTCTRCRKPTLVRRLHVYGNLAHIEATYVCSSCEDQPQQRDTAPAGGRAAAGATE